MDTINLYQHYGLPAPAGAEGLLHCWAEECPAGQGEENRPALLILPGGGYAYTSPREAGPVAQRFQAGGFGAFSLAYSCAPATFPTALREAAMAMRFLRENGEHYGVDPNRIAAVGFSAGAHLCGTLGTLFDGPEVSDIGPGTMLRPEALGLCYPVVISHGKAHDGSFQNISGGDEALRRRLSLDKLVRPDMPPVFLWHTRDDASVLCRNSLALASALEEAGVDFAYHLYHRGCHGLSTADETVYPKGEVPPMSADIPGWPEVMMDFFAEVGFPLKRKEKTQ